jgi:branched-chain amino acid transport system substrate-binding protein
MKLKKIFFAVPLLMFHLSAFADINIGVNVSTTGPAASLGIPEKNTVSLLPKSIGGQKINYIILDDASDTTASVKNTRKLISEDKVDLIIGSSITPASLAMVDVAAQGETPMISVAASAKIVEPVDGPRRWVFKTTQNDIMMALAVAEHMANNGVKTVGFIGFSDAYGEGWYQAFVTAAELKKIKVVSNERFVRTDSSVSGQALRIMSSKPDAVLIAASGTPAVLPQKGLRDVGFKGAFYQTHGVANNDFLRVGGRDVEGTFVPVGPILIAPQLPNTNPVKKSAMVYHKAYEDAYGKGSVSTFGGHMWDAGQMMTSAIPAALKVAKPGTKEFRAALRNSLENIKDLPASHGIYNTTPSDHLGLDQRSRVMVKIENGSWKYEPN